VAYAKGGLIFIALVDGFFKYRYLKGLGVKDKFLLGECYLRACYNYLLRPKEFTTVGGYLRSDITVRSVDGLTFFVRARSEDLGHYAATAKPETMKWFEPESGQTVIDVGASVGKFSLFAASKQAKIVKSIEPNPETYAVLEKNVRINGVKNIRAINAAIGNGHFKTEIFVPYTFTGTASLLSNWEDRFEKRRYKVDVVPLDDISKDLDTVDWLLIDVEGYELDVLMGGNETLRKTERIIIEISDGNQEKVKNIMASHNFILRDCGEHRGKTQYSFFTNDGHK
jgi:FkbM family methyltransferase